MASVRKRGNSYQITVSNGRNIYGKQLIETATFVPDPNRTEKQNQKALEKFVFEFEEKVKSGKILAGEKMTYQQYIELWLKDYAYKQLEQTSIERCESSLNNLILPAIGHLKLAHIQPLHIQGFYDSLEEKGFTKNGVHKNYKPNTLKRIHQIISSSLNTAVQWQLIESNPCSRVKPPKVVKNPAALKHFTLEQAQVFLDFLDESYVTSSGGRQRRDGSPADRHKEIHTVPLQQKVLFNLALFGGFRLGELIALTWDDVDFTTNTISITKSTARTKDGMITKTPKTLSSIRKVTLPAATMKLLHKHKLEQVQYRFSLGSYWKGDNYLFIQEDGRQMDLATPNHSFKRIIRRYNKTKTDCEPLPEITLHGLRHTSATLLIAQNMDVRTVSNRLGHAECSTTMNIYAHALKKRDEQAADSLAELFHKKA